MIAKKKYSSSSFKCLNCGKAVLLTKSMGTAHRNHCPNCLWSKHLMKTSCGGAMKPICLTFKKEGVDKCGKEKIGELMLIHLCLTCQEISINRIAADDESEMILKIFQDSKSLDKKLLAKLTEEQIEILTDTDKPEILTQLYGKMQ